MSIEYDEYLKNHINNVQNAMTWMFDNLNLGTNNYTFSHDESKYSSDEYDPYDMYFYGGNKSYKVKRDFDYAWLHHIHNNPHHWQYWVLFEDDPDTGKSYRALEMPKDRVIEMIADWWSFSWKEENLREIFDWYDKHKNKMILHNKTRKLVEDILNKIKTVLNVQELVKENDVEEEHIEHSDDSDEDETQKYGIPELKKYPMPDKDHIRSAIRFFNYVDPKYEQELAEAIIERAEEYGFDLEKDISVGDENRFKKYISK